MSPNVNYMTLEDCLTKLAGDLGADANLLRVYAAEDTIGGAGDYWSSSSISANEGKLVYAVIRYLYPEYVVEVGAWNGCSASNILAALKMNDFGHLVSIDLNPLGRPGIVSGLSNRWTFIQGNAEICNWNVPRVDLLLEDSEHTERSTRICVQRGLDLKAGFVFSHDAMNAESGARVRKGLDAALPRYTILNLEDSQRGFAYWYKGMKA